MGLSISDEKFKGRVEEGINDDFMRGAVRSAQERLQTNRLAAANELGNWEDWRSLGEEIRQHVLNNLDYYLYQLSENVSKRGGHVFFAQTAEEASRYIKEVVQKKNAKKVIKSKSMVTEEIGMNEALMEAGSTVVESDLGEYILQVAGDHPSHIVAPALHKNKDQIRDVFRDRLGYTGTEKPEELAAFARKVLREEFLSAEIGITGCNFAIAESGSVGLVTNEGNADMVTTLPKTQIAVMGMERLVPTYEEFEVLVSLLTRSAVGQRLTSYITTVTGPKEAGEVDGPEEFHLVIVDNGRSDILGTEFQQVLQCIRCAACINVCPVYRNIGGHSYGSIYPGPIGAVLSPLLGGYDKYKELPYASSLCGACTEACPVKIPLHELLIKHRQVIAEKEKRSPVAERLLMKAFGVGASKPGLYGAGAKMASKVVRPFLKDDLIHRGPGPMKPWTDVRDFPAPNKEPFRDWFEKREKDRGQKK